MAAAAARLVVGVGGSVLRPAIGAGKGLTTKLLKGGPKAKVSARSPKLSSGGSPKGAVPRGVVGAGAPIKKAPSTARPGGTSPNVTTSFKRTALATASFAGRSAALGFGVGLAAPALTATGRAVGAAREPALRLETLQTLAREGLLTPELAETLGKPPEKGNGLFGGLSGGLLLLGAGVVLFAILAKGRA